MPSMIVGNHTQLSELQDFARQLGNEKIRAKSRNDGTVLLYTSTKQGSGLKNYLFGTSSKRQDKAYQAISDILFRIPRPTGNAGLALNVALTHAQSRIPTQGEIRGDALKDLVGDATVAVENSRRAELRQSVPLRNDLPLGMNVNGNGVISGQAVLMDTQMGPNIVPLDQALTQTAEATIDTTTTLGGVTIASKSSDDMVRMNLTIPNYGPTMGPPGGDGTQQMTQKKIDNARAIRDFAGNDNAAKVLSSFCNQYMLRRFEACLDSPNGDKLTLSVANRGNPLDFTHIDQNGIAQNVGKPSQYAAANFNLSTFPNGDFRLSISWDLYATGFRNALPPSVPQTILPDNHVMKVTMQSEIRIDKAQADLGNISITLPQPPTMTFDGMI